MNFSETLTFYMDTLNCTAKELAQASSLSAATLSRYRSADRVPVKDSPHVQQLARGLYRIASTRMTADTYTETSILQSLQDSLPSAKITGSYLAYNFSTFIDALSVNMSKLAQYLNYDASYLSRIRSGKRQPPDTNDFIERICDFTVRYYTSAEQKEQLAAFLQTDRSVCDDEAVLSRLLNEWFKKKHSNPVNSSTSDFMYRLDAFDLDAFMQTIHYDDVTPPSLPFFQERSRHYWGLAEMRQAELDFLKHTAHSDTKEPIILCSDMDTLAMSGEDAYFKQWMRNLILCLKKGLPICMIHNLDQPFEEMMSSLVRWIPLYMTGQVTPYYQKTVENHVYEHLHYTSEEVALFAECIHGHPEKGHSYLTTESDELQHYKQLQQLLLTQAEPLMHIYTPDNANALEDFMAPQLVGGTIIRRGPRPPFHTIPLEILERILDRNAVTGKERDAILAHRVLHQQHVDSVLSSGGSVTHEICLLSREEWESHPVTLDLSYTFINRELYYEYDEYLTHYECTKEYGNTHPHYKIATTPDFPFCNIQLTMRKDRWVMVSKTKSPTIHFVILHPALRQAIEHLIPVLPEAD